jgi:hypothetical protein
MALTVMDAGSSCATTYWTLAGSARTVLASVFSSRDACTDRYTAMPAMAKKI